MPAIAVPLIAAGIGAGGSIYAAHEARAGQQDANAASAPLIGAQTSLAQQQQRQGAQQFNFGFPLLQRSASYYGSLLNGNRASVTSTLAPTVSQINQTYSGASRNLDRMAPGAGRDEARAELDRQRAGQVGGLPLQARQGAAASLMGLGESAVGGGTGALGSASSIYGQLIGANQTQQNINNQQDYQLGQNLSQIIGQFLQAYQQRQGGSIANRSLYNGG